MKRYEMINYLIAQNKYKAYLEVGCANGKCQALVKAATKLGIDPDPKAVADMYITSDEFFCRDSRKWDIIFIDGLHEEHQVDKDIVNSLAHLNPGGVVVLHDCYPIRKSRQVPFAQWSGSGAWQGTVWRSIVKVRATRGDLNVYVVNADCGVGILRPGPGNPTISLPDPFTYEDFAKNAAQWLTLVPPEHFLSVERKA